MKKTILVITFSIFLLMIFPTVNSTTTTNVVDSHAPKNSSLSTSGTEKIYWEANGTLINNEYLGQYGYQLCTDGAGGAIIVWFDDRLGASNPDIYAQRIDANGQTRWTDNGTVICNNTGWQGDTGAPFDEIDICSDGNGGAIITWRDKRDETPSDGDIYAQRIDLNGQTLWTDNGTVICNSTSVQRYPTMVSDNNTGAIITWQHTNPSNGEDIHAQRINSTGDLQWGKSGDYNGAIICNDIYGDQQYPKVCSDGDNGAIITWFDYRSTFDLDIYAQLINATGQTQWGDGSTWGGLPDLNGTIICNENGDQGAISVNNPAQTDICSDENGGAIITWFDERYDSDGDIYAQKINSTGFIQWGENGDLNGTLICNKDRFMDAQNNPKICSDENGGAFITWVDHRDEGSPDNRVYDIYAQLINSNGQTQWGENGDLNGTAICNEAREQSFPQICIDGSGGAIITWEDQRVDSAGDVYAQLINSNGQTQWKVNGTLICNAIGGSTNEQYEPQICSDGYGGAIIVWRDNRDDASGDVYAQRIGPPILKSSSGGGGGDDDDDKAVVIIAGYDLYILFGVIGLTVALFIKIWKKSNNRFKH